LFILQAGGRKQ